MTKTLSRLRAFAIVGIASALGYVTRYSASRGATMPSIADVMALAR